MLGHRPPRTVDEAISAGERLSALLISEHTPLFGFMEHGYRFVIVLTIASEAVAIALLTLFLVGARARAHECGSSLTQKRSTAWPDGDTVNQRPVAPGAES